MTSATLYPSAVHEGELDIVLDDDLDMEDGEIDPVQESPFQPDVMEEPQHSVEPEAEVVRPNKKRKLKHNKAKVSHSKAQETTRHSRPSLGNDDFWDDSELIEAWDRAMDRHRRKERGEPVSESEVEPDQTDEAFESHQQKQTLTANDQAAADAYVEALWQQTASGAGPSTAAPASAHPDQNLAQLTDGEIVQRATQYSYMAGYYAGYLAARRGQS